MAVYRLGPILEALMLPELVAEAQAFVDKLLHTIAENT